MSSIEWTDATWNPIVGCSRVSAGCEHCYAERFVHRGMSPQHRGLTVMRRHGPGWTGEVRLVESKIDEPLRWTKPRRVFVNSLSDLFHESVPDAWIDRIFARIQATPGCTFQILTKRAARMRAYLSATDVADRIAEECSRIAAARGWCHANEDAPWPLDNVDLIVSVEHQAAADERVPLLLETPAARRGASYEPALGPINWRRVGSGDAWQDVLRFGAPPLPDGWVRGLDWIVVGGESGPGARPFDLAWARGTIAQCRAAGVPVFVKQLGAKPYERAEAWGADAGGYDRAGILLGAAAPRPSQMAGWTRCRTADETAWYRYPRLASRKGGDMAEWPEDLRVREMPEVRQ